MAKTILIVEDNGLNMKLFDDLLKIAGYVTLQAGDGRIGFKMAMEHRPDLIIMDIQLPEISGLEVTKMIRAEDDIKHTPIIAVTAFAMKGDRETMLQAGCDDYIPKPIAVPHFLETIMQYIGE
ncbi:MAG: response regulator [Rhodospirillaceae bacterium]|jgi:two-component system, cell cycle response regulator DivK|nr:response regulator [Rhodospirillaceae bacterium]